VSTNPTVSERITAEVTSWPGVEAGPGDRGSFAFRLGRREFGHLHGDRVAHFAFPRDLCAELRAQGRVTEHPVASPGLAARALRTEADVDDVIALLRLNYDRAVARHGVPGHAA
jgi:hypothetical protein